MISYNITTGDTLTKVFQRIPGGLQKIRLTSKDIDNEYITWKNKQTQKHFRFPCFALCCSRPRSHPRGAPLCDLVDNGRVHAAAVSLSKHREAREGEVNCCAAAFVVWQAAAESCLLKNIPVCHQVSFLSMVLTFFILIVVIIRAATLGPQMYGLTFCKFPINFFFQPLMLRKAFTKFHCVELCSRRSNVCFNLQWANRKRVGICQAKCSSGCCYHVFRWVYLWCVDLSMVQYSY